MEILLLAGSFLGLDVALLCDIWYRSVLGDALFYDREEQVLYGTEREPLELAAYDESDESREHGHFYELLCAAVVVLVGEHEYRQNGGREYRAGNNQE